ncbi:MAG: lipopolysaccharide assembly protein LapA domain-containing protein [Chloroflexota bacterium]
MQIYWILTLLFGIVIAIFAVQNSTPVTVSFLWLSVEGVAVSVLILISAALGALLTLTFGVGREVRLRWSRRATRRESQARERRLSELEEQIRQLEQEKAALPAPAEPSPGTPAGPAAPAQNP